MVHSLSHFRFTLQAATTCLPSSYLCCDCLSPSCGSFPSCLKPTLQAATTCLPSSDLCCDCLSHSCGSFPSRFRPTLQAATTHPPSSYLIIIIDWKNILNLFSISCVRVGIKCTSNRLCMCLFCLSGVGCATANWRSRFKPADQS